MTAVFYAGEPHGGHDAVRSSYTRRRSTGMAGPIFGGEQQMVAIARALISKLKLLMLDEPSLGLSPNILADVFEKIVKVNRTQDVTILIVKQKVCKVLTIADHVYSLKLGQVAYNGLAATLADDKAKLKELFL